MATKTNKSVRETEKQKAIERLREWLKPGDTVYTILRHVSRSGMQRTIGVIKIDSDAERALHGRVANSIKDLSYNVSLACGIPMDRNREGVKVGGCGMDMGAHLVYEISARLFRGGFGCIGEGCPSNDHSNGDRDYRPHIDDTPQTSAEVGTDIPRKRAHRHYHKDGGYALKQRWM